MDITRTPTETMRPTTSVRITIRDDRLAAVSIAALGVFAVLTGLVASGVTLPFDQPLLDLTRGWTGLTGLWTTLSDLANIPLIFVGVGILLWLAFTRRVREALVVAGVLAAATIGSEIVKELVARPRPIDTDVLAGVVYSYPSGHVLEAITIYGIISLKVLAGSARGWVKAVEVIAALTFVVLVGVARVALGAHYPSDVLGGSLAAIGVLAAYAWLTDWGRGFGSHTDPPRSA
jgi:undecaprenyl-diphosphatase